MQTNTLKTLPLWIIGLILIGWMIGQATNPEIHAWYRGIARSPLTPPDYVFGIVWTILYAMLGTAGWLIWSTTDQPALSKLKTLYVVQMLLNWSWSPVFFAMHWIAPAFILIFAMLMLSIWMIVKLADTLKLAAYLLIPYTLWLAFAGYLNAFIMLNN